MYTKNIINTLSTIPTVIYSILNVIGCPKIHKNIKIGQPIIIFNPNLRFILIQTCGFVNCDIEKRMEIKQKGRLEIQSNLP